MKNISKMDTKQFENKNRSSDSRLKWAMEVSCKPGVIERLLKACVKGSWSRNEKTGLIDINGDFSCQFADLYRILTERGELKFGECTGDFSCNYLLLTTLKGSPKKVGSFDCGSNLLTSLEFGPVEVLGEYYASSNRLASLYGAPEYVGGNFIVNYNKLVNLLDSPQKVLGYYICSDNDLTSLEGITLGSRAIILNGNKVSKETLDSIYRNYEKYKDYRFALLVSCSEESIDGEYLDLDKYLGEYDLGIYLETKINSGEILDYNLFLSIVRSMYTTFKFPNELEAKAKKLTVVYKILQRK